jgi:hypothetical protein
MQDAELLANYPPDNEQRFHQHGQIGKVLDKLPDTRLVLDRPDRADLETEVGGMQVVLGGNDLRLKAACDGSVALCHAWTGADIPVTTLLPRNSRFQGCQ